MADRRNAGGGAPQRRPGSPTDLHPHGGPSGASVPDPAGDALLPIVAAVIGEPHRGRRMALVVVLACCHCRGVHRHLTAAVRPTGLRRSCPVTGLEYVVLRVTPAKAVRHG